jgi:hypothetical protein
MTGNVVDLMSRRADRGETVIHFRTAVDALAYASGQIRDLERLADSSLLIAASELEIPLAQVAAILAECSRLHARTAQRENA